MSFAVKSRVLMSIAREEADDWYEDFRPLVPWQRDQSCPTDAVPEKVAEPPEVMMEPVADTAMPTISKSTLEVAPQGIAVVTVAVGAEGNITEVSDDYQALMHPDIAVSPHFGHMGNYSAELETA